MRRLLIILLIGLGILAGGLLAARNLLAESLARHAVHRIVQVAAARGVTFEALDWERVHFVGLRGLVFSGVSGRVHLRTGLIADLADGERAAFGAERIVVTPRGLLSGVLEIVTEAGEIDLLDSSGQPTGQNVSAIDASLRVDYSLRGWRESLAAAESELRRLIRDGRSSLLVDAAAVAHFQVDGRWHDVRMETGRMTGDSVILLSREDVVQVSKQYVHALTEAEIDLVVRNPARAPALLRLSEKASAAAEAARRRSRSFPADAYRHVYWSWMLTRQFGPEFSEQVTDAHEVGATYERGAASRRMDLRNNAVGRAYALAGVPESDLVQRVMTDPNVQRSLQGK